MAKIWAWDWRLAVCGMSAWELAGHAETVYRQFGLMAGVMAVVFILSFGEALRGFIAYFRGE